MKKVIKVVIGLTALILVLKGLSADYEKDEMIFKEEKIVYGNGYEDESFNDCITMKMLNGYPAQAYKADNVYLLIDKETKEVTEYLAVTTKGTSNNWFESIIMQESDDVHKIYEIPSGDLICYYYSEYNGKGLDYLNNLVENSYLVRLKDLELYVEDEALKEWYSIREIKAFEPEIVEAIEKIDIASKRLEKRLK